MTKDFKNNPALQFISGAITDNGTPAAQPKVQEIGQERPQMSHKQVKLKLLNEKKTKRLNLVLQPTIHQMAQDKAKEQGQSLNNFIINAIIEALED